MDNRIRFLYSFRRHVSGHWRGSEGIRPSFGRTIAGVDHAPVGIMPQGGAHQVQIVLSPAVGVGQVPLTVSMDGRNSPPYYMRVVR